MKIVKYILGIFFILGALGALFKGMAGAFLLLLILGASLLPPISDYLKEKVKIWKSRGVRYVVYIVLFLSIGIFAPNNFKTVANPTKTNNTSLTTHTNGNDDENEEDDLIHFEEEASATDKGGNNKKEGNSKKYKFESCDFVGGSFYIIPDMVAADVYINFEDRGFSVDKNIKVEGTSIYCELATPEIKYVVVVTGCTPSKIISIEASTLDYSGNHLESVTSFLGYVATLQYKNSEPEKARKWVEENIEKDGATTTIGGVTFSIHFKSEFSKSLIMHIKGS